MKDVINNEIAKLLRVDGCTEKETIKVLAIRSKILNTKNYVNQLTALLDSIFSQPTFDISTGIAKQSFFFFFERLVKQRGGQSHSKRVSV